jgi:hypothetical protein
MSEAKIKTALGRGGGMLFLSEAVRVICKFRLARRLKEVGHGMYGIKEQFEVERSFLFLGVGTHYEVSTNIGVSKEGILRGRTHRSLLKAKEFGEFGCRTVGKQTTALYYHHMIE